ncbi:MAG: hypothetical protein GY906_24400 [bacterium]|nr:hypothetical protein [bacterium]
MASPDIFARNLFDGGWATDFGPAIDIAPDRAGIVKLPFLVDADNVIYELDGGPHKAPGTTKVNSSGLESGATIRGIFDYWITGTGGSATQHRIMHVGTKIKKDDADGSFSDIFSGVDNTAVPSYAILEDLLVIADDANSAPKSWDGTTAQNLAGSPPNFAFVVEHKNRLWAAGVDANASRLYYSALLDPDNWTGAGSGEINISPSDGDRITGLASHQNSLLVFKGPYKGSIQRIIGTAPTGGDAFERLDYIKGIGSVNHNAIFRFGADLGFMWSDGTIHSLNATERFGDFEEAALTKPIHRFIRDRFAHTNLDKSWAVNCTDMSVILVCVPIDSNSEPNYIASMDYRFNPPRWASWTSFDFVTCLAQIWDAGGATKNICMAGCNDGFMRKLMQSTRSIDGTTGITFRVTTPHNTYARHSEMKTLNGGSLGLQPKNTGNITFGWTRDGNAQQTATVAQGGADGLGSFILDTSTLGGGRFVDRFFETEEGGEFRSISYQVTNATNNEDVELHSISTKIQAGGESMEN